MKPDTQQIELIGCAALEAKLIQNGFEVARPHRDKGIDLYKHGNRLTGAAPTAPRSAGF